METSKYGKNLSQFGWSLTPDRSKQPFHQSVDGLLRVQVEITELRCSALGVAYW